MFDSAFNLAFGFVIFSSLTVFFMCAWLTRGVCFYGKGSDNEKIVVAAANCNKWRWPSDMHRYANGKATMKEFAVLLLALTQKLIRDKNSDYALTVMCLISNAFSAVLVFLTAAQYWNVKIALFAYCLFLTSFWHQLIALWGGVVAVSQVCCLSAVYFFQMADVATASQSMLWYLAAGAMTGFMLFSSASSRKYLPLCFGAFVFSLREEIRLPWGNGWHGEFPVTVAIVIGLCLVLLSGTVILRVIIRPLVVAIHEKKLPFLFSRYFSFKKDKTLEEYLQLAHKASPVIIKSTWVVIGYLIINLAISHSHFFWQAQLFVFWGILGAVCFLSYPDILKNLKNYYLYSQYGKPLWRSRFYAYRDYFSSIGRPISDDMRGAGVNWLLKYFHLMSPLVFYLFWLATLAMFILIFQSGFNGWAVLLLSLNLTLGLSPILMGELSKGVQVGRAYYPGFLGGLCFTAYAIFHIDTALTQETSQVFWLVLWGSLFLSAFWNIWIFLKDVLPARMATTYLMKQLKENNIRSIHTFKTSFNEGLIECFPETFRDGIEIRYISSIRQVQDGFVVVPQTNPKAVNMSDFKEAKGNGFSDDPELDRLIRSKEISRCAVASFKTLGTSRIWIHENEVPSYRDLILKEVTLEDLWRGYAWLLDGKKLKDIS